MNKITKRAVFLVAAIAATTTVGAGIASWQVDGVSVTGTDVAGQSQSKAGLTLVTTTPAGLYPTQTNAGSITAAVKNPNPFNVTLTGASVEAVSGCTGITLAHFTLGTPTITSAVAVKANGTAATVEVPITAVSNDLPDACAAQPIKFTVKAVGASS